MDLAASSQRCFRRKLPIGRGAPVLVEVVLRPQSKPSAAKSVGAMVLSFLNASAGRRGSHRGYFVRHYAPVPGYTPISPPLGWGSTPVRGQPHTSIKERIREPPPLAQKSWRRFCAEGLYASLGWLTDSALMMAGV